MIWCWLSVCDVVWFRLLYINCFDAVSCWLMLFDSSCLLFEWLWLCLRCVCVYVELCLMWFIRCVFHNLFSDVCWFSLMWLGLCLTVMDIGWFYVYFVCFILFEVGWVVFDMCSTLWYVVWLYVLLIMFAYSCLFVFDVILFEFMVVCCWILSLTWLICVSCFLFYLIFTIRCVMLFDVVSVY